MKRRWLVASLLLGLTACGGGSSGGEDEDGANADPPTPASTSASASTSPSTSEGPKDQLEADYRTYVKAFLTGDGATAYGLLSERCRNAEPLSEFALIVESAADLYGAVDYTIDNITIDGNRGSVDATYAVEALDSDDSWPWVREGNAWHSDKCATS